MLYGWGRFLYRRPGAFTLPMACCFTRARSYSKLSCEMITRIWRGWTTPENADVYQALLLTEIFPGIESRGIAGYCGISLGRRNVGDEVEFVTLMWFDSLANVKTFSGDDFETAVVPPRARSILSRFDRRSAHFGTVVPPPQLGSPYADYPDAL